MRAAVGNLKLAELMPEPDREHTLLATYKGPDEDHAVYLKLWNDEVGLQLWAGFEELAAKLECLCYRHVGTTNDYIVKGLYYDPIGTKKGGIIYRKDNWPHHHGLFARPWEGPKGFAVCMEARP